MVKSKNDLSLAEERVLLRCGPRHFDHDIGPSVGLGGREDDLSAGLAVGLVAEA